MSDLRLRRYTNLPILLDMLIHQKITLLDPKFWEDQNDSFFMEKYREIRRLKTLLAVCFTTKSETFHHWKVFSGGSSGVCLTLNMATLLACFEGKPGVRTGQVDYKRVPDLQRTPPTVDELPFLKRVQYKDEGEFRIIFEDADQLYPVKDFKLDLKCIERITLSPWLPASVSKTVKEVIRQIDGCSSIELVRTGVIDNVSWKNIAKNLNLSS